MKWILLGIVISVLIFLVSCKASKNKVRSADKIVFGTYGGFAGSYDEFTLFGDGNVEFRNSLKGDVSIIKGVEKKIAKQLFRNIIDLRLYEMDIHDPGNLTYFIQFEYDGKSYELKWGGRKEVPDSLKTYYKLLRNLTKDRNPVM